MAGAPAPPSCSVSGGRDDPGGPLDTFYSLSRPAQADEPAPPPTGPPRHGRIYRGDCIREMQRFRDGSVDLIVTSPPYNIKRSSGNGLRCGNGGKWPQAALIGGYATYDDAMPYDRYVSWQRDCIAEMMRVLAEDGAIFYNHKWRVQRGLIQDRREIVGGFPVRQVIIWQRAGGINFNPGYFLPTYEVVYLIAKPGFRLRRGANRMGDIWRITQEHNNDHPAPFPIELAARCIGATDARVVLDPFMGSGTTAIAAEREGRAWVGIDISREYCDGAMRRIKRARRYEVEQ